MECGADCIIVNSLYRIVELVFYAKHLISVLLSTRMSELQSIGTLAGVGLGLWKWYEAREKVLFERLEELLVRDEKNLRRAAVALFDGALRPSLGNALTAPFIAKGPALHVLHTHGWTQRLSLGSREQTANKALDAAVVTLQEQRAARLRRHEQLEGMLATAHLLRGCVDSISADAASDQSERRTISRRAIHHYDDAIRLTDQPQGIDILELKGYELISIEEHTLASQVFEEMERQSRLLPRGKARSLKLARALKYQGLLELPKKGHKKNAVNLLSLAIAELAPYSPLTERDLLDLAQIHELQALARISMGYRVQAAESLVDAQACFGQLAKDTGSDAPLSSLSRHLRRWFNKETNNDILYVAALDGKERVAKLLSEIERKRRQLPKAKAATSTEAPLHTHTPHL